MAEDRQSYKRGCNKWIAYKSLYKLNTNKEVIKYTPIYALDIYIYTIYKYVYIGKYTH